MNHPPRNQFELSEQEERTPKDAFTAFQDRRALSIDNRARFINTLADDAAVEVLLPPRPSAIQARQYGPLLAAALRRLVAECEFAIRNHRRIDDSQLVRVALSSAMKTLREAAELEDNANGESVA